MADADDVIEGKLPLLRNPVLRITRSPGGTFDVTQHSAQPNLEGFGYRDEIYSPGEEVPEFERHTEATNIEVFYDLFFAANLCVFAEVQDVTNAQQLATFVCYFCLLWFTWLGLGLFDVRFVTDSIFERCARAVHFGAMVGFAVIAPTFKLNEQDPRTFRTMTLILTTSRVALASQYGTILWHVRKFKSSRVALGLNVAVNVIAAIIYLGVAFAFRETGTEALWVLWFAVTVTEVAVTVWGSLRWEVLSFYGTHLTNRVSMLTFILMGEGIVTVCSAVAKIVLNANQWTSPTIGNVTAGVANIYLIYMIYMDWRRARRFSRSKQLIWSFLHLPFHLALKLFILASSQFVIWWKVIEVNFWVASEIQAALMGKVDAITASANISESFAETFRGTVDSVFETFVPQYYNTMVTVNETLDALKGMPSEFWDIDIDNPSTPAEAELAGFFYSQLQTLSLAIENSLLANFKIDGYQSVGDSANSLAQIEEQAEEANRSKFNTVIITAYAAAGFTLMLLNVLFIISRSRKWTPFNYIRKAINFLVGIGLCLVPLITTDLPTMETFVFTPWPLPTIVLTFFVILVINHLPHPPPIFFRGKAIPQEDEKAGSGSPSLAGTAVHGAHEQQKSGYQNVSIHDQDTDTAYQGPGNGQGR
ncbi:hypothetical protein V8F20_011014 [Naviculisporaceae sp. PSN 640]